MNRVRSRAKIMLIFLSVLIGGMLFFLGEYSVKAADWVIDLGPEAGDEGGNLVYAGTPEKILSCKESHTAKYL